jgi:hypothetical protein
MSVAGTTGRTFKPGTPQQIITAQMEPLPAASTVSSGYRRTCIVTSDGQRFLVNVLAREQNTQTMQVILNWPALLRRR